jgi:hypothetical protein
MATAAKAAELLSQPTIIVSVKETRVISRFSTTAGPVKEKITLFNSFLVGSAERVKLVLNLLFALN